MGLFDDKVAKQLKDILSKMKEPVKLSFFTQEFECRACGDAHAFVKEIASFSKKITLSVMDFLKERDEADRLGVDKVPAIVVHDKEGGDLGVRFYGLPGGYEINSFVGALLEASGVRDHIKEDVAARIAAVKKDVHIQVFVTLTCPYCPGAVSAAHRLAMENEKIRADMIDSALYPHLVQKYQVSGVPRIIINETGSLTGAQPVEKILEVIEML
ncbi:MAG: thioredoxin family protein [Spirochaetes bacterium]|nr:thioredoxin family protein [Spirochaetota bacterium]